MATEIVYNVRQIFSVRALIVGILYLLRINKLPKKRNVNKILKFQFKLACPVKKTIRKDFVKQHYLKILAFFE